MYDPNDMEALTSLIKLFPEELMKAMGFSNIVTDLTGYLASWLYGLLMLGNRLVAKMVDNSSFSYLLSTPNSRIIIIVTQGVYALTSAAVLFAALFGIGVLICVVMFPNTGSDIYDIIGFFHNIKIMFNDDNGIAQISQFF